MSQNDDRRTRLRGIADSTLDAIEIGSYSLDKVTHDLSDSIVRSKKNTRYYAPDSLLSGWSMVSPTRAGTLPTEVALLEVSTLDGARLLANAHRTERPSVPTPKIGVLNFASARKPGGGFLSGAQAQEESIARSSTLYPTLMTRIAQEFYTLHNRDGKGGYYSHAMIYSPGITVFRNDSGDWVEPLEIDVLTSAAVNAGVVRQTLHSRVGGIAEESRIVKAMRERMARVLFLFERQGVKNIVLGSFGTGVFKNSVNAVATIWEELLLTDGARFKESFERVTFAILGRATFEQFEAVFQRSR